MSFSVGTDVFTPQELVDKYPMVKKLGWNASKVGIFFHSGLLQGKIGTHERKTLIFESSFISLIDYAKQLYSNRPPSPFE